MPERIGLGIFAGTGTDPGALPCAERFFFSKGDTVTLPPGIGLIEQGGVKVTSSDCGVELNAICEGGMFGVSTLFAGENSPGTSLTASSRETVIIFISQDDFAGLLASDGALLRNYLSFVSRRICFLSGKVGTFVSPSAEGKLLRHIAQNGGSIEDGNMKRLAAMLSMSRASLYRALRSLAVSGRVERSGGVIRIL